MKLKIKRLLKDKWDHYFIFLFLVIRLILNVETQTLSVMFVIVYAIFLFMLTYRVKYFAVSLILFLSLDNILATYFATSNNALDIFYLGTIFFNLMIIFLLVKDFNKSWG